jgi:hypothetical protein
MSADTGKLNASNKLKASKQDARDQRRAAALRENLRRRKSQARARAAEGAEMARMDEKRKAAQSPPREAEP